MRGLLLPGLALVVLALTPHSPAADAHKPSHFEQVVEKLAAIVTDPKFFSLPYKTQEEKLYPIIGPPPDDEKDIQAPGNPDNLILPGPILNGTSRQTVEELGIQFAAADVDGTPTFPILKKALGRRLRSPWVYYDLWRSHSPELPKDQDIGWSHGKIPIYDIRLAIVPGDHVSLIAYKSYNTETEDP